MEKIESSGIPNTKRCKKQIPIVQVHSFYVGSQVLLLLRWNWTRLILVWARECPECVGDGISFSGCGISEQQRHLTEQLSHQFHARVAGFQEVEEEEEEGEARDDLPLCSSILSPKAKNKKTAEVISYYTTFCMPTPDCKYDASLRNFNASY